MCGGVEELTLISYIVLFVTPYLSDSFDVGKVSMSGCAGRQLDQDEPLRGNSDGKGSVRKCKVLRRERFACCAKLSDLIAGWERGAAHRIKCLDYVSMVGV